MSRNLEQSILSHSLHQPWFSQGYGPSTNVELTESFNPRYQSICSTLSPSNAMEEEVDVMAKIRGQDLWTVNSRRRNGLIIHKEFYTEFAGPGAAIGGSLDADCRSVIALGSLSLVAPESVEEQQKALRIRLQWVRLTQNFTDKPVPLDRARMILEQFKSYFDQSIVDQVPDEAFALLVGVLPPTVRRARALL
ncbi:MAG: hypothetical protein VKL98_03385 [Cyanobacteriota bacterium]|nr:hypothetical protein [Cyanobacteriota bacterium]